MSDKPYISSSQLGLYEMCGEAYRRSYIEKEKIPPGIAMIKGIGVHGGSRANFRQKKDSHQDLPKKDIAEISVTEMERSLGYGVMLTPEEDSVGKDIIIGKAKDSVVVFADLYSDFVAPEYQPVFTEEKQRIVIPDSSHDLMAVMDVADDKKRIVDLKSTGKKKTQKDVDDSEQLSFYSLVYKALTGELPEEVRLEVLVEKKQSERQLLVGKRDMADLTVLISRINTMIKGLSAGIFMPCPASFWKCNPMYCGYFNTCKFTKRRV